MEQLRTQAKQSIRGFACAWGVAHVVDMLYGAASHDNAPTPDVRAATVRKLKSLGIWGDIPSALQGALAKS